MNGEDVGQLAVVAFRPYVAAVARRDQLRGHADAIAGLAHAAFEDVRDIERLGDAADVVVFPLERKCRGPGNDSQPWNVRQFIEDFLREAIAEVLVRRIRTHIGERQHRD